MIFFEKIQNMPLALKIILGGGPILAVIVYAIYFTGLRAQNRDQFYEQEFSSTILRKNVSSSGRAMEFHLSNDLKIYFGLPGNGSVRIGDSIVKESNTYIYDVYRKDINGKYEFLDTYNFLETL